MKYFILAFAATILSAQSFAAVAPPCYAEAWQSAHQTTGDQSEFVVVPTQKVQVASGVIYQYAFFTTQNYRACKVQIQKKDYSCNSAVVDVLQDTYNSPVSCKIIDSLMGDGNG